METPKKDADHEVASFVRLIAQDDETGLLGAIVQPAVLFLLILIALSVWSSPHTAIVTQIKQLGPGKAFLIFSLMSVGLYLFRCRTRLLYGLGECVFGMAILHRCCVGVVNTPITTADSLSVIAGMYIFVRGLDNVGKWINVTGRGKRAWTLVFGKHFT